MPSLPARVYVVVTDQQTGAVVLHLGPYATDTDALAACGVAVGDVLFWTREGPGWVTDLNGQVYRVSASPAPGA